jgi:uncharacterized membrane protein YbhN (UPF0104 family)
MRPGYSLGVLKRIRVSKWVRVGLLAAILAFCSYGLVLEWPQVHPALGLLHWYSICGAVAAAMAGAGCMMLAWRRLLADLGSKLPIPVAARVTFVAQLGKYVPGAVWSFAAHVELGHDFHVPRRRGAASVIIALAVAIGTGLLIAAVSLPLASPAAARKYLLFLAAVPLIAVCLAPPVLHRLLDFALKIIRQEPLEQGVSWRGLAVAMGWTVAGWLLLGLQVWLLLTDVAKDGVHSVLISVGAYALACSLALLLVVFPGGIGAREVILVATLAPVLPQGSALAVALVARVVTTVSDLTWGGIAFALARHGRSAAARSAAAAPGLQAGRHVGKHRESPGHAPASSRPAAESAVQPAVAPVRSATEQGTSLPVREIAG